MSEKTSEQKESIAALTLGLVAVSLVMSGITLFYVMNMNTGMYGYHAEMMGEMHQYHDQMMGFQGTGNTGSASLSQDEIIARVAAEAIPTGVPPVYGAELGVSFDSVPDSLNKMASLENSITLSGDELQRYINAGTSISCEYCCGAESITTMNGQAACGCAHSAAMRGLAKYLIKSHGSEFSDAEVLAELQKWKAVYFPKQTIQREIQLKAESGEISPNTLAGLPDMVGGC